MRRRDAGLVAMLLLGPGTAPAQDWLILGGVIDVEGWATDSGSRLLTRNDGQPGGLGRLTLWAGAAPSPRWQLVALVGAEAGPALRGGEAAVTLDGLWLRVRAHRLLAVQAGRILSPMGGFGPRRLSPVNPLIDRPDTYPPAYPWGGEVSGASPRFDYRVAVVSLPVGDERYLPTPGHTPRLVAGAGVTPFIGARLGVSYTRGPYLGPDVPLPGGVDWRDFGQWVFGIDGRLSRGYADLHGEVLFSSYDVPISGQALKGTAYYVELKYTWHPRLYTAVRLQRNRYPFIRPRTATVWTEVVTAFNAGDVGVGVRLSRNALLKVSYQQDDWETQLDGKALAVQVSYAFDVAEVLLRRPYR